MTLSTIFTGCCSGFQRRFPLRAWASMPYLPPYLRELEVKDLFTIIECVRHGMTGKDQGVPESPVRPVLSRKRGEIAVAVVEMTGISLIGPEEEIVGIAAELLTLGNFEPVPLEFALERRPASLSSGGARITTFQKNPYDELLEKLNYVWKAAGAALPEELCAPGRPAVLG